MLHFGLCPEFFERTTRKIQPFKLDTFFTKIRTRVRISVLLFSVVLFYSWPMASNVGEQEMDIQPDLSDIDTSEVEKVSLFFDKGFGCKLGPKNSSCSSVIARDLAVQCRNNCQQLESSELDIIVMSQLQALRTHPDQPLHESRHSGDTSTQRHTFFYFHKLRICVSFCP